MPPKFCDLRAMRALLPLRVLAMPVLTPSNTVYTHPVAKVMISIPDKLLERLDARAKENGESRSGFLQRLAEREVQAAEERKRQEINRLWDQIHIEPPADDPEAWDVVRVIREDRESH